MNQDVQPWIGYCTNVHAGADLQQTRSNLQQHAIAVKQKYSDEKPMGIGLWLSHQTAQNLEDGELAEFADWLQSSGLVPFTLNGFPYGDFHQPVVKHLVYEPTWFENERLAYTLTLASIQDRLLPEGMEGSISTLPLCWGSPTPSDEQLQQAGDNFAQLAEALARREQESGRLIYVCIEPEPGCQIQQTEDLIQFYAEHLLAGRTEEEERKIRRHIRVCHDVCHAAVMFESQQEVFRKFHRAGILVGKVQVSSAISLPFSELAPAERAAAVEQLSAFAEDRYLHQTVIYTLSGTSLFFEDLPKALSLISDATELEDPWRVHFHVPIYLREFGHLQGTQDEIQECLKAVEHYSDVSHFEVETYAWGVLPPELQHEELAEGIAAEMKWFDSLISAQAR